MDSNNQRIRAYREVHAGEPLTQSDLCNIPTRENLRGADLTVADLCDAHVQAHEVTLAAVQEKWA